MVSVRKRGKVYEYRFEIATVEGTRKWITKSGYPTKAYNDFYYNAISRQRVQVDVKYVTMKYLTKELKEQGERYFRYTAISLTNLHILIKENKNLLNEIILLDIIHMWKIKSRKKFNK